MGDEKSGSSDVEVDNADNDSVFSDPRVEASKAVSVETHTLPSSIIQLPKQTEIGPNAICVSNRQSLPAQSNHVVHIAKTMGEFV